MLSISITHAQLAASAITEKLSKAFVKSQLPGMGVALVNKDSVLYLNSFGHADLAAKKNYETRSIQNIGSISKTLIGISLMKLVDQGKLNLDDPINKYLPFMVRHPKYPESAITIRHLATHTSGIKDIPANYDLKAYYLDSYYQKSDISLKGFSMSERVFLKNVEKNKRHELGSYLKKALNQNGEWYNTKHFYDFKPGSYYEYSNLGAALAGYIVEIASGLPYTEFTKSAILDPLGMETSGWFYDDVDMDRFVTRYVGKKRAVAPFYELSTYPDGGLKTSVADLSLFLKEMLKGFAGESDLLSKQSFKVLFENQISVPDGERIGIFWDVFGETGVGDIGHSGVDPGIYCFMYFKPSTGIGKILLTNASGDKNQKNTIEVWEQFIGMENYFLKK